MIDEIFEMVMKEARRRPGKSLQLNTFLVLLDVLERVNACFNLGLDKALKIYSKSVKTP